MNVEKRIADLEGRVAVLREACAKAEATCAVLRLALEAEAKSRRTGQQEDQARAAELARIALASDEVSDDLLSVGRTLHEMLEAADHILNQAEGMEPKLVQYLREAWGWDQDRVDAALLSGQRWFAPF